jgi:type VI protein secretion system component VasK
MKNAGKYPSKLTRNLARWREIFFAQKYRFDLGQSFLVVLNFTLLIITASDKLMVFFGIPRLRELLIVIIPFGFLCVWIFGLFMDKVVRAAQMAERQSVRRSEVWQHHNDQMDRLERRIEELQRMIKRRK